MADPQIPEGPSVARVNHHRSRVRDTLRKVGAHHRYVAEKVRAETVAAQSVLSKESKP